MVQRNPNLGILGITTNSLSSININNYWNGSYHRGTYSYYDYLSAIGYTAGYGEESQNSNLAKVSFEGANLFSSSFKGANLFEVNMTGANITGAIFDEANLSGAIWIDGRTCALGSVGACK